MRFSIAALALALTTGAATAAKRSDPFPLGPDAAAESSVREMLSRDLSTVLTVKEKEGDDARFLFPDLRASLTAHARDFDADIYTGVQDTGGFHIGDVSSIAVGEGRAIVLITFDLTGETKSIRLGYDMRKLNGAWRVYDITYFTDGESARHLLGGFK